MGISSRGEATPLVLAIETSTVLLGVSVVAGNRVVYETALERPRVHSKMLLPLCIEALDAAGVSREDLSCIAVSAGPGSFTGLRIGCATAQGLGFSLGITVVLVPTFEVYLYQCLHLDAVAIVQGKARGQTVCALYVRETRGSSGQEGFWGRYGYREAITIGPEDFSRFYVEILKSVPSAETTWVAGDAAAEFCDEVLKMRERFIRGEALPGIERLVEVRPVDEYWRLPRPGIVGIIGSRMFLEGKGQPPSLALPQYYRKSQAEATFGNRT